MKGVIVIDKLGYFKSEPSSLLIFTDFTRMIHIEQFV